MRRSSRKTKRQQSQKSITPFTVSTSKMADDGTEDANSTPTTALTLQTLRHELQAHRDEIKAEIGASCRELKGELTSLRHETKTDINALRAELTGELTKLHTVQAQANEQLEDMGKVLSETMDRVTILEESQQELTKKCKHLQEKCLDLENRSRRRNLRIVGVPENSETGNMITFVPEFLRDVLGGDIFGSPLVIDRAHRSLGPKPSPTDRPRTIVVCFHYYTDKQKVLDTSKAKGNLLYNGRPVHIFPDVSPEVGKLRAAFTGVKKMFRDAGVTYSLFFPARLVVTFDGTRHSFDSPQAARVFYDQNVAKSD